MTMDKERNMNTKADEKQWTLVCVPLSKVPNQICDHKYHAHEGSTVQRCIFISYVCNVQPEGGLCHGSLLQF